MSAEFLRLFATYTADPDSIGRKLGRAVADRARDEPLIVATATDIALYPGGGRVPTVEGFRLSTRGFKELTAISHLGPAVASLVRLRDLGEVSWREDAKRLLTEVKATRAANNTELWRDRIAVEAYRGKEHEIADMVDRACAVTTHYLTTALADGEYLTPETLRRDYLDDGVSSMMVATFFLVSLDICFRVTRWLTEQEVHWERAMVVVAGRQGRPTAGVTWNTSSVATMILAASRGRLPLDRVYVAPHAPTFSYAPEDLTEVIALEEELRALWCGTRATVELGEVMFAGYPRYAPGGLTLPDVTDRGVAVVSEMPAIHSPEDMRALVTRLRVVLEDPRQLLSSCVTDFAAASLAAAGNDPTQVVVPGLNTP
ncbi:hypothetical protein FHR32_007107 [Streptosporangium album]|uniref:DUF5624 domain-containing protein n=1 Tax=Streptosporangium album TaxID=47479 RepID=A0A7W7S2Z3_9ACTN|nr:DUF5624 domain-containing protein [Streptosporangium album]MBB4942707.1 hypothetical protein [Streptosporangium album]